MTLQQQLDDLKAIAPDPEFVDPPAESLGKAAVLARLFDNGSAAVAVFALTDGTIEMCRDEDLTRFTFAIHADGSTEFRWVNAATGEHG